MLDLPTPERWNAELTLLLVIYSDGLPAHGQVNMDMDMDPSR